jgi:hypothetical protein
MPRPAGCAKPSPSVAAPPSTWICLPDHPAERVLAEVQHPRGSRSLTSHLKSRLGLDGIKMAILHELLPKEAMDQPERLACRHQGAVRHADRRTPAG